MCLLQKCHGVETTFTLPELIHGICNFTEAHAGDFQTGCNLPATAFAAAIRYVARMLDFQRESPR